MLRSFDDLGTPLHEVTFCVVDLETTGASAQTCEITEVGAARFRGGERLGTFQTLVDPCAPIAPAVSALTGITDAMVQAAPSPAEVLPTLIEFVGGAVLVGHNLRFDVGFLDAALLADERSPVGLWAVDTLALARRLLGDEVPDHRLGTLAEHLGLEHRPTHRALDDVLATADLLHALLERATAFGVTVLDDLLQLPRLAAHAQSAKLVLTNRLPRSPGVAVLRDGQGQPLHVAGAGDDLRRRVRSWFAGEGGRTAGPVLREVHAVEHLACPSPLAAEVAELRLAHALAPRRSPWAAAWKGYRYVRQAGGRAAGTALTVGRTPGRGRALGPLPSAAAARAVVDAVDLAIGDAAAPAADPLGGLFAATDPAPAAPTPDALFDDPAVLRAALQERAAAARDGGRLAQATTVDGMIHALDDALWRQRWCAALRGADRVVVATGDGEGVELVRGRPVRWWSAPPDAHAPHHAHGADDHVGDGKGGRDGADDHVGDGKGGRDGADDHRNLRPMPVGEVARAAFGPVEVVPDGQPLPPAVADELTCTARWIERHAHHLRLLSVDGELSCPLPRRPAGVARHPSPAGLRCAAC